MDIKPRTYCESLETVIMMSELSPPYQQSINRREDVQQYVYIHGEVAKPNIPIQQYFDHLIPYDFRQDVSNLIEICSKFIKNPEKTRIIALSDCTIMQAAAIRDHFGIPGKTQQQHIKFHDKILCKEILKGKVRLPLYVTPDLKECKNNIDQVMNNAEKEIKNYPMFLKPTGDFASTDLFKVNNRDELKNAIEFYTKANTQFEIDEFLSGTLMEIDAVIINNEVKFFCPAENLHDFAQVYDGITCGQIHLSPEHPLYNRLLQHLKDIIAAYGDVPDDVLDVETWYTPNDELVFQELQLRRPGNNVPIATEKAIGVNLERILFDIGQGVKIRLPKEDFKTPWQQYGSWLEYMPRTGKTVKNINTFPQTLRSQINVVYKFKIGHKIVEPCDTWNKSAFVFMTNTDWNQLYKDLKTMSEWEPYVYEQFIQN